MWRAGGSPGIASRSGRIVLRRRLRLVGLRERGASKDRAVGLRHTGAACLTFSVGAADTDKPEVRRKAEALVNGHMCEEWGLERDPRSAAKRERESVCVCATLGHTVIMSPLLLARPVVTLLLLSLDGLYRLWLGHLATQPKKTNDMSHQRRLCQLLLMKKSACQSMSSVSRCPVPSAGLRRRLMARPQGGGRAQRRPQLPQGQAAASKVDSGKGGNLLAYITCRLTCRSKIKGAYLCLELCDVLGLQAARFRLSLQLVSKKVQESGFCVRHDVIL